jgi:hypothetical protein
VGGLLIALGAAGGVGFGTYFGVEALLKNNQSNSGGLCGGTSGNACNAQGTQLRNTALMDATGSTVGAIVGSVVFTGGLVVLLSAPSGYQRKDSVSVAPWLDRNGGGVGMRGSW